MFLHTDQIRLAYTDHGQGQPVVFVHGYPLNRRMWQPQVEALAGRCRTLAIDLRGHGQTPPTPPPYSIDLLADDLAAFLDALGIQQPAVIVGLSMGGYVALAFQRRYPERTAGLVLTSTKATGDNEEGRLKRTQSIAAIEKDGLEPVIKNMAPRLLAPAAPQALVEEVQEIMRQTTPQGAIGALAAMRDRPDATPHLAEILCPCLVIHGAEDQIASLNQAQAMCAALTSAAYAELQVMAEAGHMPNLENPPIYNSLLNVFLQRIG